MSAKFKKSCVIYKKILIYICMRTKNISFKSNKIKSTKFENKFARTMNLKTLNQLTKDTTYFKSMKILLQTTSKIRSPKDAHIANLYSADERLVTRVESMPSVAACARGWARAPLRS